MAYTDYNVGHATGQARAADAAPRAPAIFRDPPGGMPGPGLVAAEIDHFKAHGFVVKRRLLDADDAFAEVLDHLWANVPRGLLRRDDPATWGDIPPDAWTDADVARVGRFAQGNWKLRSPGADGIGTEPFLVDRIAAHPRMIAVAEAFLGAPVARPRRVRGIYAVFPKRRTAPGRLGPHADYMAAHIAAMVLVHDVPPGCGGFTLWPGSHLRLHPHWDTVHGGRISEERSDGFRQARDAVLRDIEPVEITGGAGDVVFWHPRMLHSAGINRSAEPTANGAPTVRVIVPCDYQRAGYTYFDDDEFGPGEKFQWWVDTRNFREDAPATPDNIWRGWGFLPCEGLRPSRSPAAPPPP